MSSRTVLASVGARVAVGKARLGRHQGFSFFPCKHIFFLPHSFFCLKHAFFSPKYFFRIVAGFFHLKFSCFQENVSVFQNLTVFEDNLILRNLRSKILSVEFQISSKCVNLLSFEC